MKKLLLLLVIVICIAVAFSIYARLAPSDAARWHVSPKALEAGDMAGSAVRRLPAQDNTLKKLHEIIQATPRTSVLAGSLEEGMITYVTRSALFGFPDYTTVEQTEDDIVIHGRLRFGAADLGVNAKRIDRWLGQL